MRIDRTTIYRMRAAFGVGFIALGLFAMWRVAIAPVPLTGKLPGGALALAMIGLGIARLVQYLRTRKPPST